MLLVDPRVGSGDLAPLLEALGVPVALQTLDFGDAAFVGFGPGGEPRQIGIEVKRIGDLLSSLTSQRFAGHQLPGLVRQYDAVWLVIEGLYRPSADTGVLETLQGTQWRPAVIGGRQYLFRDLEHYLTTMEVRAGLHVRRTGSRQETARVVAALFSWWTGREFEGHRAHLAIAPDRDLTLLVRPSLVRRVAAQLPGIGYEKSGKVAQKFRTVRALAMADEHEWREIDGIGKTLAKRIVQALTSEGS